MNSTIHHPQHPSTKSWLLPPPPQLINDDGFIYRRLKRQRLQTTVTAAAPPPDPTAEAKARRERKKKVLLKLKTSYQQEIDHWALLSNTLKALQDCAQNQPPSAVSPVSGQMVGILPENMTYFAHRKLADTLIAQEVTISDISRLCDVAEALCDAEEQWLRHPLFDLPIWEPSPRKLIASLLEGRIFPPWAVV